MLRETVAELLNMILGHASQPMRLIGLPIQVLPPLTVLADTESLLIAEADCIRSLHTQAGSLYFLFSSEPR